MKLCKNNTGVVIILVAGVLLFFLIFFLVVGIDFAYVYYVRGEVQAAADSAALAGAALLTGEVDTDITKILQGPARSAAWKFACKNKAAHDPVYLVNSGDPNCNNPPGNLNNSNSAAEDIVVGYWKVTPFACASTGQTDKFCPANGSTGFPINAVKVVARRTKDSPGGEVGLIFQKIVQGLVSMGIKREAIAEWELLGTPGLSLCINSCTVSGLPKLLDIQSNLPCGSDYGVAWTVFKSVTPIADKDIRDLIDRRLTPEDITDLCTTNPCITTKNGTSPIDYLGDKFRDPNFYAGDKDIVSGVVTAWRVGVVIFNYNCFTGSSDPCKGCPPSKQGHPEEPYHIQQWARVTITQVCDNNDNSGLCQGGKKGVVISDIICADCNDDPFKILKSDKPRLVK